MSERPSSNPARRVTPAIGDEVRVPAETHNEFARYGQAQRGAATREPIEGLIASIREISSGKFLKVAAGDARRYVFDLVDNATFDPRVSSKRNCEGAAVGRAGGSVAAQVQRTLRQHADRAASMSGAALLAAPPFSTLLDGWRLVRVCAERVEVKKPPQQG